MSEEINVLSRTQVIIVDPTSGSVSIINAGPIGPAGPSGVVPLAIATPITLFSLLAPSSSYSWTEVEIACLAALITRFTVHSTTTTQFAIKCSAQPLGAGEEMFSAVGMPSLDYELSWPWWYSNDDTPRETKMYVGIRNLGAVNSTFSITDLRGYSLEV